MFSALGGGGVPLDEVGGRVGGREAAREDAEGLSGAEVRLHAGLERRELLRVHLRRAAVRLVRTQLQTFHAIIITSTIIRISTSVFVVVFLLSLSQSSTVKFHVSMSARRGDVTVLILRRDYFT